MKIGNRCRIQLKSCQLIHKYLNQVVVVYTLKENMYVLVLQWILDLRKPGVRKNLDLRKVVATTNFLVNKMF